MHWSRMSFARRLAFMDRSEARIRVLDTDELNLTIECRPRAFSLDELAVEVVRAIASAPIDARLERFNGEEPCSRQLLPNHPRGSAF
jgi:hypothetical protein